MILREQEESAPYTWPLSCLSRLAGRVRTPGLYYKDQETLSCTRVKTALDQRSSRHWSFEKCPVSPSKSLQKEIISFHPTLLVAMSIGVASLETSIEVPSKTKQTVVI